MKREEKEYPIECREVVRTAAFEFADSGVFSGWEAVEQALCSRFDVEYIRLIFASHFCRLDLDRRCEAARVAGHCRQAALGGDGGDGAGVPVVHDRSAQAPTASPLSRDIAALLADGCGRTAAQVAQQLGAAQREVQGTLRTMLANDEVHATRHVSCAKGGRSSRIFTAGPGAESVGKAAPSPSVLWPKADPDVVRAMDALARCG